MDGSNSEAEGSKTPFASRLRQLRDSFNKVGDIIRPSEKPADILSQTINIIQDVYKKHSILDEPIQTYPTGEVIPDQEIMPTNYQRVFHGSGVSPDKLADIIQNGLREPLTRDDNPYAFLTDDMKDALTYARRYKDRVGTVFELSVPKQDLVPIPTVNGSFGFKANSVAVKEGSIAEGAENMRPIGILKPEYIKGFYLLVYDSNRSATAIRINPNKSVWLGIIKALDNRRFISKEVR